MTENEINRLLLNDNTDIKQTKRINSSCDCVNKDHITDNLKKHIVCINCGVVINENIEAAVDYNEGGDNNSKYGPPTSYFFPKSSKFLLSVRSFSQCLWNSINPFLCNLAVISI